ncbi:MAG: hypothetical protein ACK513_11330 [Aphanizomenon sp.]|jgi:WD40 repeat protein|uniref:N-acetylglucosamine kinase n=1 Tax=Aphanizomenon flos-aquae LD13 TaxID=1710894 RepID=A0A1B7VS32_APHFL|nr:hypothetical protein [Aphanizomenon flos-aquae UKL13-PB]MBO1060561.1 hypothetical protein [Aphanizomenon flos-aquae CP01]OBQ23725.1 MAG: N-acetylglucosamine kinase [Aphanizomenon flos-aquae LD13]HCQ22633.1 hypothetical protein [Anabaena sp. UBA12330]
MSKDYQNLEFSNRKKKVNSTIKIWDLGTDEEIATFTGESPITCCLVAPDGVTIVAGEGSGRVHFLRLQGR